MYQGARVTLCFSIRFACQRAYPRERIAVSPDKVFPLNEHPQNPVTQRILEHPRVTFDIDGGALVMAIKDELLVRVSVQDDVLRQELGKVATLRGELGSADRAQVLTERVQVWRLNDPKGDAIDEARRLRAVVEPKRLVTRRGGELSPPAVSPNHVCVVSPHYDSCPAGPPNPVPPPQDSGTFVEAAEPGATARVVVIDTGYICTDPPHAELDARVSSVPGHWLDTSTDPATWRPDPRDTLDADHDGRLDGVAGHGTFIAGLVANRCRQAEITVVGQRHAVMPLSADPNPVDQAMLFTDEISVANSLLQYADADVISCGFSFPTLDDFPSIPFVSVMDVLTGPHAPRPGVAVVSPAGNESSPRAFWPAAHPDVFGVAATNRMGNARAWFSNWGSWADCCVRGQDVASTYIYWHGAVEGEPLSDVENFLGWARWDGTSFAAPKVAAEIARRVAAGTGGLSPFDTAAQMISGATAHITDTTLSPPPGVPLPHLRLG
jgi:hypothetical protein